MTSDHFFTKNKNNPKVRLFIPHPLKEHASLTLDPEKSHYIKNVMRLKESDFLGIFNGYDGLWLGQVLPPEKKNLLVSVQQLIKPQPPLSMPCICLAFAHVKRWDWILEKTTETGVQGLIPLKTRRSLIHSFNTQRGEKIIQESCEQSGRLSMPKLFPMCAPNDLLKQNSLDLSSVGQGPYQEAIGPFIHVVCHQKGESWPYTHFFQHLKHSAFAKPLQKNTSSNDLTLQKSFDFAQKVFMVWVGPEGGWSPEEENMFQNNPNVFVLNISENILRAETAATLAPALLKNCLYFF